MDGLDSRSLSERLADLLRGEIESGRLAPGDRVPSERALAEDHSVSRDTVRRAVEKLTLEGLIVAKPGSTGRFVRNYDRLSWQPDVFEGTLHDPDTGLDAWQSDVTAQGHYQKQSVEVEVVEAPEVVAKRLGVPEGTAVVARKRIRWVNQVPYQLADSYYPRDIAESTVIMQPGNVVVRGGLMATVGHPQVQFVDEITARMPTFEENSRLNLPPGTPVAVHVRTGFDGAQRPVRVIITILPGDRHRIVYRIAGK